MISNVGVRCVGCGACVADCPQKCLALKQTDSGFKYPQADTDKCIDCSLCDKVCPVLAENKGNIRVKKAFAVQAVDSSIVTKSSSGGAFYLLSVSVIKNGGSVCGVEIDKDNYVHHTIVDNIDDLYRLMGSKYVQSDVGNVYSEVKKLLSEGKQVLFSGTPCQVNALYSFLGKSYDNLLTVDVICHGVPAPYVWQKYVDFMEEKYGAEIVDVRFRSKPNGWNNFGLKLKFNNGKEYFASAREDAYLALFLANICLRKTCYSCEFKGGNRMADITIGDFWGIEKIYPELYNDRGISLVVVNTDKGICAIDNEPWLCGSPEVDFDKAIQYNSAYYISVERSKYSESFRESLEKMPFDKAVSKCLIKIRAKGRIASYFQRIKRMLKK